MWSFHTQNVYQGSLWLPRWLYEKLRQCFLSEEDLFEQVAQQVEFVEIEIENIALDLQNRLKLDAVLREFDKMDISK